MGGSRSSLLVREAASELLVKEDAETPDGRQREQSTMIESAFESCIESTFDHHRRRSSLFTAMLRERLNSFGSPSSDAATPQGRPQLFGQKGGFSVFQDFDKENRSPITGLVVPAQRPANSPLTPGAEAAAAREAGLVADEPGALLIALGRQRALLTRQRVSSLVLCRAGHAGPEGAGRRRCAPRAGPRDACRSHPAVA